MEDKRSHSRATRLVDWLEHYISSWRFPFFTLSVLFFFSILVVTLALIPVSDSGVGSFAEEFKTWCLGYNPATGEIESIYLVMFMVQPAVISTFVIAFWYKPLTRRFREGLRPVLPYLIAGLAVVLVVAATIPALYTGTAKSELPFPAEELRTELNPPSFTLTNQNRKEISLSDFRGDVALVTSVYASCAETCPRILSNAKELFDRLPEPDRQRIHLLAVSMDPGKDNPKMLRMTAEHYGLTRPNQHLLTGKPDYVNDLLDQLNIPRNRRSDGSINHANLFLLIDKDGKIAYRFTLGERQQEWLEKATRILLNESREADNISHNINAAKQAN